MTSRLDRLLLLLDTGSSNSVRNTAAKQLAQLAVKGVTGDVSTEDDIKSNKPDVSLIDASAWSELMAVVARIIPFLHSKSHETRSAASTALSHIFSLTPLWQPGLDIDTKMDVTTDSLPAPEYPSFSVQDLILQGKLLLASSGKEFIKPSGILASSAEVKKARKEAMGRLGLDFLDSVADDIDLDKELADDDGDIVMGNNPGASAESSPPGSPMDVYAGTERTSSPATDAFPDKPAALSATEASEDTSAMSARERNRLKRKRKVGNSAFVAAPPPQSSGAKYSAASAGPSKVRLVSSDEQSKSSTPRLNSPAGAEKVVIDPSKGGAVSPKEVKQSKALDVAPGRWIWDGLVKVLEVDLFSVAWQVRHGAAMALRELLKIQGKHGGMRRDIPWNENEIAHEKWCNDLSAKLLCVLVVDRFGDFVSDQVVAPVREMISQTLASLLIHMPRRSVLHVHAMLLQMIQQDFVIPKASVSVSRKTRQKSRVVVEEQRSHVWEVRHAGLLGIKYEVAVRSDLFEGDFHVKQEDNVAQSILQDVVEAAILGLGDPDDDVRAVAAACLTPVAKHLVEQLEGSLDRVLTVLWQCLNDMKDDLNSSVSAVMDLLGKLVSYEQVIHILAQETVALPLTTLAPTLYPFFRHTITNVRLAVVNTLQSFMEVSTLPREWIDAPFLRLLFQNLLCEEREDVRVVSLKAWNTASEILTQQPGRLESVVTQQLIFDWYAVVMTPLGVSIDSAAFYHPSIASDIETAERHNVDKNMLSQDASLITVEVTLKARLACAKALACLILVWPGGLTKIDEVFKPILTHYVDSASMIQKFLGAVIAEEWATQHDARLIPSGVALIDESSLVKELSTQTLTWLQAGPPAAYHEQVHSLHRIHADCIALLHSFHTDCKLPISSIPFLGNEVDPTGTKAGSFNIETARMASGQMYNKLKDTLGRTKKKEIAAIGEKRNAVIASIDRYIEVKAEHDSRVSAAFAAAFVSFKSAPDKVSPIVKGIMNGIKTENNLDLQTRSAVAVAAFIDFCLSRDIVQPPDKIVKNLCTFLCQDIEKTPTFSYHRKLLAGIISSQGSSKESKAQVVAKNSKEKVQPLPTPEEAAKTQLSRRGACLAFDQLSVKFGGELFNAIPSMWSSMAGGLVSTFQSELPEESDELMEKKYGQDVIDSLSVLEAVTPALHRDLWPQLQETFPMIHLALRSKFAIIRQLAARCFATLCDTMTSQGMRFVVENIIPSLGDPLSLANRQGATELIYHIVQRLDLKALAYVIFMVVPVLGRMSDPDDDIRSMATNTFASLIKMVPLEAGLPDPEEFPPDLLKKRESERQFLMQLLDGSKVEQYELPVTVNAELRKYQQDGVSWLAFLAKYQLHGILCDDMGLGKTLQSICILASKHHERAQKHKELKSPDTVHLPSLIICPPTLTGHWYYEIQKYVNNLKPILYTGNSRDRTRLLSKLQQYDVVVTSYEVVRNDIEQLQGLNWLYCILDEGHVIKNGKTKLTKAVKCIRAQHRVILSGTPIQNNVLELWSLFDFLMPGFLGSEGSFNERFGKPILADRDGKSKNSEAAALAMEALHKQVLPFLLRRLKEDVLNDLPPKIIQDYYCDLSELQKFLYDDFSKSQAHQEAESLVQTNGGDNKKQQHVFQSLQYLRKLCNHPSLVLKDPATIQSVLSKTGVKSDALHEIQNAPKLLALRQLLQDCGIGGGSGSATALDGKSELLDTGSVDGGSSAFSNHRVLIFCQMKQMLDIIETDLFKAHMPSVTYMRLDGSVDSSKRHAIVQTFNADPSIDVLLLTTHVGGLGLTLTGADTVIFVEHDWNPMKDLQAMDRAHRIGQKKVVNVYRLITKGTLEEKIMGLQRFKLNIANSVVTQQNSGLSSMDTDLVLDLFRRTSEEEDAAAALKKKNGKDDGPISQKSVLQGLEDLPAEEEYEGLDLSSFMGSIGR